MSERTTRVISERDRVAEHWLTLPTSPIVSVNARNGNHFRLRLTSNATLEPPFEPHSGQRILLRIEQDGTGGWTLTPNSAGITVKGSVTEDTTAGAVAFWEMVYDEVAKMWEVWSLTASSSAGANTALSNLASVAINTGLVSDTDNTDDLGTSSIYWRQVFVGDTIVMKNATKIQANSGSSGTIYFDTAAIHLSFSAKPVSLWAGTMLALDAAVSLGSTPGTSGFTKSAASGGNLDCKYEGTVVWRIPDATTFHLVDVNLKLGVSSGTKIGTTTAQKLGFWGATPVVQQAAIADATDAADAVTKFNTLLATLRTLGIIAT